MKIAVCDVCQRQNGSPLIKASWRTTWKDGLTRLTLDLCPEHRYFGHQKTQKEVSEELFHLYTKQTVLKVTPIN